MSNVFVFRRPPHGVITEYFGGGKGGSTTTTNNVTQIPPEVLARYNAVNARAEKVAEAPYQSYSQDPNAFVAPLSATQQAGIQNTNIMAGAAQPYYGAATDQLIQAQAGAQPGINAAYQNVGQAQNVGNQYANAAAQQYGAAQNIGGQYAGAAGQQYAGAQGAAAPYYQAATQGLAGGLNYANPLNQAAAQAAGGAFGAAAPYYQAATQGTQQALQGAQPYQGLATAAALSGAQGVGPGELQTQQYMNPFTQNVVQATQAALNQQQGQQLAQQQADAIKGGAFGSGRAALQRAQLQGQQSLAQSQAISPLLQQNYQQALAAAQQQQGVGLGAAQANRAAIQQAGQQLGALGQQTYGQQLGAANQMANLGQNLYGQGITGAQTLSQLGQTGYGQQLSASQLAQALGQGLYGQALGTGQALQGLGQQQYGQALGTGQAQAALGQQQYGQGQATAQQLAALAQQGYGMGAGTSAALAGLGTNAQQAGLAGAQAQLAAGQQQQQTQQAGLQALYNQFQQQQGFPYQQAQFLANIATGTGALSGNASSGTSTTTGGGGFFSDERLKENIKKVGETNDGQPIYRYNYKGDQRTQIGLLAQDVEKAHPEAVGSSQGYKTVDYKKATEDAIHKEDGGALSSTDAYRIDAPSAMLRENSGKGLGAIPTLPQMVTGRDIPIEASARNPMTAGLRTPEVKGVNPESRVGAQAELESLLSAQNQPPGPNGALLGSGPGYIQSRIGTLQDWLNKNASPGPQYSSAGGLVGPEGGAFAHGGSFARGGLAEGDYMNPALAYYSPQQAQQGVFQLQPMPQRQILQGTPMQAPQQRQQPDAVTSANQMAGLVGNLNSAYKARPDFLRSAEDIVNRKNEQLYRDKVREEYFQKHGIEPAKVADKADSGDGYDLLEGGDEFARGGYAGRGYVNPYGGLGGNDILGPIIEEQDTSRRLSNDKVTPPPQPKQQSSGLGELVDTGLKARSLYKGGEWAAGKLGLGGDTAMSATSASAVPGVAGGVVPEAVTAAVPEALTAAVPEALTAAAPEVLTAAIPEAAASIAEFLPFLLLKNGGAVPHRKNYQDGSLVVPDEYSTAEPGLAGAEGGTETATQGGGDGETVVRGAPLARQTRPVPTPADAVAPVPAPREPKPGVASASRPSMPDLGGLIPEGAKDTLSSENFWVPAIAGLGAMLASPNKTLAGAIGSGLVGGTTAYTGLQKQQGDIAKQRIEGLKSRFVGPTLINGQMMYRDTWNGDNITQQEYSSRVSQHITGKTPGAASPAAVATARKVVEEGSPEVARPAAAGAARTTAAKPEQGAAAAPGIPPATGSTPPAAATSSAPTAATGTVPAPGANLIQMDQAMLDNEDLWKALPPPMRPKALLNDAAAMDEKIRRLEANRAAIEQAVGETDQSKAITAEIASLRTDREAKVARAQQQMTRATKLQEEAASAEIKRKSEVQQEADIIELLPRKQQLELQGEIGKRGAIDPLDIAQKQREADIQREREVQTAREKLPLEEEKAAFDANVKRQNDALQAAAKEAKDAQVAKGQAVAALSVMFDKNGKAMISTGPLGPKIANVAAYMSQLGFSDVFIKDFTNTSPSNAQALAKLQTAMAAEIARLEFAGAPVRQTEFLQFLETTPSATLLPEAFKWIVENTILPKANSSINAYKKVKDFTPGIGEGKNIQGQLFDYYEENPWFKVGDTRLGEEPAARTSNRAPVAQLTDEQKAALAEEIRARRAAKGTR